MTMSSLNKFQAEKNQRILLELANQPGNDLCADCKARAPRWASHNLGIFICVNCASIHRKIGTHITKVKSLTLDSWSREQVENMKQNGNIKSNALYNPDETRHPPPTNMIDSERDSELEKYIRDKYEFKKYMQAAPRSSSFGRFPPLSSATTVDRSAAVAALLGPSRSAANIPARQQSRDTPSVAAASPALPQKPSTSAYTSTTVPAVTASPSLPSGLARNPLRSASHPASLHSQTQQVALPQQPQNGTWGDLRSLQQSGTIDATLPLQIASFPPSLPTAPLQSTSIPITASTPSVLSAATSNPFDRLSVNPNTTLPSHLQHQPSSVGRSMSLGSGLNANPAGVPFASSPWQAGIQTLQPPVQSLATQQSLTPSPNPFSPQPLPAGSLPTGAGVGGLTPSPQLPMFTASTSPYGHPNLVQQPSQQQLLQPNAPQVFQPQPTGQFMPVASPYGQPQSTGASTPFFASNTPQPYAGSTPSPFGQMQQPIQQTQMQQGYSMQPMNNTNTNPFTSWVQQPPQQQQGW